MIARAFVFAILVTLAWLALKHIISTYGAILLSVFAGLAAIYLFGRFVGPKLPAALGGDPVGPVAIPLNREWDMFLAVSRGDLVDVQACLEKGANPFAKFAPNQRPQLTNARNCYEYALETNRDQIVALFERHRRGT